jgi:predicted esterase
MSDFIHQFLSGTTETTVLALHGTGGNENDLVSLAQTIFPGANVLSPRGNISENGANRFFRRFAEGIFDLENLREETEKLANFVIQSSQRYGFAANDVIALGYSNGANIAASVLLSRPEILRGAILLRAMTPFEPQIYPELRKKPIFLAAGLDDSIVGNENVLNLAQIFNSAEADVTLHFSVADHSLRHEEIEAAQQFVAQKFA